MIVQNGATALGMMTLTIMAFYIMTLTKMMLFRMTL
jgi:hypothetical protein